MKRTVTVLPIALFVTLVSYTQVTDTGSVDPWPGCQAYFYYYYNDSIMTFAEAYPYSFVDMSSGEIIKWNWEFGDGETSNERNPLHFYDSSGVPVKVCLTIATADGCESSYCAGFVVGWQDTVVTCATDFTIDIMESYPPVYHFTPDKADSLSSFFWDFGDGTYSWETSPVHQYEFSGIYSVCLNRTSSDGCTANACKKLQATGYDTGCKAYWEAYTDVIISPGSSDSSFSDPGSQFYFHDLSRGSVKQWKWDFGDGTGSTEQNPVHRYDQPGVYQVCLDIFAPDGCADSYCDTLYAGSFPSCNITGTVKDLSGLDGCGLVIVLDNGEVLEPAEIVPYFELKNGQRVRLSYTELTDRAGICMAGKIVRIDCIEVLGQIPQPGLCDYFIKLNTEIILNGKSCNGSAIAGLVDIAGNTVAAAEYRWSTGDTGPVITGLCPGMIYSVIITGASGCAVSASFSFGGNEIYPDSLFGYWNFEQEDMRFLFNIPVYNDSIYCEWDFGDGSTAGGPSVSHTYRSAFDYIVVLNVYDMKGNLLYNQQIPVTPGAPTGNKEVRQGSPEVFPVPATGVLYLKSETTFEDMEQIEILSSGGQQVIGIHAEKPDSNLLQLDISTLPAGFYIGRLVYRNGFVQSFRFVK